MTATTSVYPRADILGETYINLDSGMIFIDPGIEITAISNVPLNVFFFGFRYFGYDWADLNEIIIKIGDNRYSFSNCFTSQSVEYDSLACESITFPLKTEALPFMQDFVEHQNDEIKVRLKGDTQSFDFVLTDDMKNCFILMFNLFTSGGGTDKANMQSISEVDQVVVRKNKFNPYVNSLYSSLQLEVLYLRPSKTPRQCFHQRGRKGKHKIKKSPPHEYVWAVNKILILYALSIVFWDFLCCKSNIFTFFFRVQLCSLGV